MNLRYGLRDCRLGGNAMRSEVGFVGLGTMGLPMTRLLAEQGIGVLAYDADWTVRERAEAIAGVQVAGSLVEIAAGVGVLFTCLPNDRIVREVYLGEEGILTAITSGAITVDCSTISPAVTRQINAALAGQQICHMDAAMLGSLPQAETGEIGFVVGDDRHAFEEIAPLLDILGRFRKFAGPAGPGPQIKLIHQMLVAVNAVAVAESVALCLATGSDLDTFYEVVCGGGGFAYSRYFEKPVPRMRAGDFTPLFTLSLMTKDGMLTQGLARNAEVKTPLLDQIVEAFMQAGQEDWGAEDFSAVADLYEAAIARRFDE
jgi:3-hydroxyisobutyrate dehydrogenase